MLTKQKYEEEDFEKSAGFTRRGITQSDFFA